MSEALLIRNGRLLDPSNNLDQEGDLFISEGKVTALDRQGKIPAMPGAKTIDAKGAWILPGLIDTHVHLREPGQEYKETIATGTRAAVAGGFTAVACMANTEPVNDNPYVTAYIREKARQSALCRVYPVGAVSRGLKGEELAEIGGMVSEGARALSDDGMPVMNSYLMRKAMDYAKAFDVAIISHSEDLHLVGKGAMNEGPLSNELGLRGNPAAAEEIMVAREIALARLTGSRVHIAHVSTRMAIEHIRRAKEAGLQVTAEVTPHHLTLSDANIRSYDTHFKMAPPLRTEEDVEALRRGLAEGVIDLIATDHAPHGVIDKLTEFDQASPGVLGLQTAVPLTLALVRSGAVPLTRWVQALTSGPARLLGLHYEGLKVGAVADVTVIHPDRKWQLTPDRLESKSSNTPFMGWDLTGSVLATIVGGRLVYPC